jgi:transcriptional regulator with XRE-family HTH domain
MGSAKSESVSHPALNIAGQFTSEGPDVHVSSEANGVCFEQVTTQYLLPDKTVKTKMRKQITEDTRTPLARAVSGLRKSRKLTQASLAQLLGLRHQSAIARWEGGTDKPSSKALLQLSELAPDSERAWWRERAAEQAGLDAIIHTTSGAYEIPHTSRTIPLIKDPKKVGTLGQHALADIEQNLLFAPELFPEGGKFEAVRIEGDTTVDLIAIVDVSRRDPDRMVGDMVAVLTATGIEVRWLSREDTTYILLPFQPGQTIKLWRHRGDGSIVGRVRWVGNSIAPPKPAPRGR